MKKKEPQFWFTPAIIFIAVAGCTLTFLIYTAAWQFTQKRYTEQFQERSAKYAEAFRGELHLFEFGAVTSIASLFTSMGEVSRSEFKLFVSEFVSNHGSIQALEWVPVVPDSQKWEYVFKARSNGFPGFRITEKESEGRLVEAQERPVYFPVFYVEPYVGNEVALGFDLASNPSRYAALEKARDTGQLIATEAISLVQEPGTQLGILVSMAVYGGPAGTLEERQENLRGFALGVFRIGEMIEGILGEHRINEMALRVDDITDPSNVRKLYVCTELDDCTVALGGSSPEFETQFYLGDRTWRIIFQPTLGYMDYLKSNWLIWVIIVSCLLITMLFAHRFKTISERNYFLAKNQTIEKEVALRTAELSESEARNRTILQTAVSAIVTTDGKGVINSFNTAAEAMFGYASDEVLGRNVSLLMPEPYKSEHDGYMARYMKHPDETNIIGVGREVVGVGRDKRSFQAHISIGHAELRAGEHLFVGFITDISKEKAQREALLKAMDAAEAGAQAKALFLANMSHEIRTPLNGISGLSRLVIKTSLTAQQHDYMRKIDLSTQSLLGLINDILDFSKIEAGKLDIDAIDYNLNSVLGDLADMISMQAQKKGLDLIFFVGRHVPIHLEGAPLRIGQVLRNLASNAVKFTQAGEIVISVDIEPSSGGGETLRFEVSDTGIGISEEIQNTLFEAFTQGESSVSRQYGGTGLGLAITRQLVKLMGGKIDVESVLGTGSVFSFVLPCIRQTKDRRKYRLPSKFLVGLRVLLLATPSAFQKSVVESLEGFSFRVTCMSDVRGTVAEINRESIEDGDSYGLIVMDAGHQVAGVEQVVACASRGGNSPYIPVICVVDEGAQKNWEAVDGVGAVLVKPVLTHRLFNTVLKAFGYPDQKDSEALTSDAVDGLHQIRGARILLVEDNEINRQVALENLEEAGFSVDVAHNGLDALNKVKVWLYDAVLMDIQMPVMDGLTAMRKIREMEVQSHVAGKARPSVPIIAMTAHALTGDRNRSIEAGMSDYITKPIDFDALFSALVRWVPPITSAGVANGAAAVKVESPGVTGTSLFKSEPGVDVQLGLKRMGGKEELYCKMLNKFSDRHAHDISHLMKARESGDIETAVRIAHSLKSVAGALGAMELSRCAGALEGAMGDADGEENIRQLCRGAEAVMQEALASIDVLVRKGCAVTNEGGERAKTIDLESLLYELKGLLQDQETGAARVLSQILGGEVSDGMRGGLMEIKDCLAVYDFEKANGLLVSVMEGFGGKDLSADDNPKGTS